mmetsp:Transcript_41065/g.131342  ORF Transcript_41065/g.131342 Transcript_41065/m.131342 type:complete len:463 (+) Transcript_41065:195-1583(+)
MLLSSPHGGRCARPGGGSRSRGGSTAASRGARGHEAAVARLPVRNHGGLQGAQHLSGGRQGAPPPCRAEDDALGLPKMPDPSTGFNLMELHPMANEETDSAGDMGDLWFDELLSAPIASPLRCEVCSPVRSADDAASLYFPAEETIPPALCRHVFGYKRTLQEDYALGQVLGSGSYGVVRLGKDKETGGEVAIKSIPKVKEVWTGNMDGERRAGTTSNYLLRLQNEVNVLARLRTVPGVVRLMRPYEDNNYLHLVMQLCRGKTLASHMKEVGGPMAEGEAADIVRSILKVVAACHATGIIYRDVKPANFLFRGEDTQSSVLKCVDFGVAANFLPGHAGALTQRTGTPIYMAPEVILKQYGQEADLWSCGIVLYQLLFGELPFWGGTVPAKMPVKEIFFEIMLREVDYTKAAIHGVSPEAVNLCMGLLRRDPDRRLTARQALTHPFLVVEKDRNSGNLNWNMG